MVDNLRIRPSVAGALLVAGTAALVLGPVATANAAAVTSIPTSIAVGAPIPVEGNCDETLADLVVVTVERVDAANATVDTGQLDGAFAEFTSNFSITADSTLLGLPSAGDSYRVTVQCVQTIDIPQPVVVAALGPITVAIDGAEPPIDPPVDPPADPPAAVDPPPNDGVEFRTGVEEAGVHPLALVVPGFVLGMAGLVLLRRPRRSRAG